MLKICQEDKERIKKEKLEQELKLNIEIAKEKLGHIRTVTNRVFQVNYIQDTS